MSSDKVVQDEVPVDPGAAGDEGGDAPDGRPTLRLCRIPRPATGSCGFHISRTQWDPYPWVSAVEIGSPAEQAGLRAGDCVLEVNGEDVLGQRIGEVAAKVRGRELLQLLVWNAGCDPGTAVTLTAGSGPTPLNLQLLSSCLQQASQLLECPVCLEGVTPPVWQCCHGHLLCSGCRARSDRCPLCRVPLGPRGRSLLADKLHALLSQTYRRYSEQRNGRPELQAAPAAPVLATPDAPDAPPPPPTTPTTPPAPEINEPRSQVLMRGLRLTASSEDVTEGSSEAAGAVGAAGASLSVPAPATRARSQSAGNITGLVHTPGTPGADKPADMVHCPYGSCCSASLPATEVFNHLREEHDGPLTQYFPREGRELRLGLLASPGDNKQGLTVLTTKAGDSLFVHEERGCLWLWALTLHSAENTLAVALLEDADHRLAPVFPLSTSSSDVIASGRCVRVPDKHLQQHLSVRLTATPTS